MEQKDTTQATNESLLRQIIEAQLDGGYSRFEFGNDEIQCAAHDGFWCRNEQGEGQYEPSIIAFLLDTTGCKASYGNRDWFVPCQHSMVPSLEGGDENANLLNPRLNHHKVPIWEMASYKILEAWHSGKGNNVRAALENAVSLLP